MQIRKTVGVGDTVIVAIEGAVHELEIVDVPEEKSLKGKVFFLTRLGRVVLGRPYPERVVVKLPDGGKLECQLFRVFQN